MAKTNIKPGAPRPLNPNATKPKKAPPPPPSRRNLYVGLGVVVVLAVAAFLYLRPAGSSKVVELVSPKPDAVLKAPTFEWKQNRSVTQYELEIVTEGGDEVYAASTTQTTATVPANRFGAGKRYLWLVRGLVKGEAKAVSTIDQFTYQP